MIPEHASIDHAVVRDRSLAIVAGFGYTTPAHLPLLDEDTITRTLPEVMGRIVALYVVVACAYGFDPMRGRQWLIRERAEEMLAENERIALESGRLELFQASVESLWALCWSVHLVDDLRFDKACSDDFINIFPDLLIDEPATSLINRGHFRAADEIVQQCDLAYCLQWTLVNAGLRQAKEGNAVEPYIVLHRRKALDWLIGDDDWDDISLDT